MVWTSVVVVVTCGMGMVVGSFYPPICPQHCRCDRPQEAVCEGGVIPFLDPRVTVFEIKDTSASIPILTTDITHNLQHVMTLQLDSVGLNEVEGGALAKMERLHVLHINDNNITTLSAHTFANCSTLQHLDLRSNNIQMIENGTFDMLVDLRILSLANNVLTTLPQDLPPGILVLDIEHNLISTLKLLPVIHLHSLNFCHNLITHIDPIQIDMKDLKILCIGGEVFSLTSSMRSIKGLSEVEQLTLKGTKSSPLRVPSDILAAIQNFTKTSLQTLQLDSCSLMSMDIFSQTNSTLRNLTVTDTVANRTRVRKGKIELPSIAILDLSGSPSLANLFLNPHHSTPMLHLKVLKMSRCGIKSFQESFLQFQVPNITKLDLSHNPLECTCYGMMWIPNYVRDGRLDLLQELTTTCAAPPHLNNIPLLTASMCPASTTTTNTPDHSFTSFSPVTSTSTDMEYSNKSITTNITPAPSFGSFNPTISTTAQTARGYSSTTSQPLGSSYNKTDTTGERSTGKSEPDNTTSTVSLITGLAVAVVAGGVALFCRVTRNYRHRGFSGAYNRTTSSDSDSVVFMDGSHDAGSSSNCTGVGGMD